MIQYVENSYIDNFILTSGNLPILLLGTHAFSDNSREERISHLSDYLVSPLLQKIIVKNPNVFYIIENRIPRYVIDMNRTESRLNDENDENDYLYRQMIRFILIHIQRKYNTIPLLFDLHSYPEGDKWDKNDIMVLVQNLKGAESNILLVNNTIKFFTKKGWKIDSTPYHNKDDIMEEISIKRLAIPLLIEFSERLLKTNLLNTLTDDLSAYLKQINVLDIGVIRRLGDAEFKDISIRETLHNITHLRRLNDSQINTQINTILSYKKQLSDLGYTTLEDLNKKIADISDNGYDFEKIFQNTILTLSNSLNSAIIPIELINLQVNIFYSNINRLELKEWGLAPNDENIPLLNAMKRKMDLVIPQFKENPSKRYNIIYKSFPYDGYYFNFIILPERQISEKDKSIYKTIFNRIPEKKRDLTIFEDRIN